MLTIRLLRTGKKNQPSYKVVVTDKRNPPRGGRFVEEIGFFNPKTKEKTFNKDRIIYWLGVGAQASDTIHNMLVSEKIIDAPKRKIIFTKKAAEPAAAPESEAKTADTKNAGEANPAETPAESTSEAKTETAEAPVEPATETPAETPAENTTPAA